MNLEAVLKLQMNRKSMEALSIVGLADKYAEYGTSLSYGQQRRLEIARALATKPELLLLDEHTAALDPKTAAKVLETTEYIVSKDHLTTLMITHNMKDAITHGNRLIMLMDGKIILDIKGEEKGNETFHEKAEPGR